MLKFKINDKVLILSGRNKNKVGIVKKVLKTKKNNKKFSCSLILEGVNLLKKHIKANPNKDKSGGIINIEAPISFSNVMLINPKTEKKERVIFKILDNNKKYRFFKSNSEVLK